MGQDRRIPGAVIVLLAVLAIPSVIVGLVHAAERADECIAISKLQQTDKAAEEQKRGLKCN